MKKLKSIFKVGDKVLVLLPTVIHPQARHSGCSLIIKKVDDVDYSVHIPNK